MYVNDIFDRIKEDLWIFVFMDIIKLIYIQDKV
jgi:hypothetical protein